jgi:hypothetical protein
MQGASRPRVFVAYSLTDDGGRAIRHGLARRFNVTSSETLTGDVARRTALRRALTQTDVTVVILPHVDDPAWMNVVFEAGAASGAGASLVLIGETSSAPADLADILAFGRDRIDDVIEVVEELTRVKRTREKRDAFILDQAAATERLKVDISPSQTALSADWVADWMARLSQASTERRAVRLVAELFEHAGARTRSAETKQGGVVDVPDLVIWHDSLLAAFGLPLPVEILMQSKAWPAVRSRLERTLTASGGQTLFAVNVRGNMKPRVWTDGHRTILVTTARDLADSLARMPLAEALSALLLSAAP